MREGLSRISMRRRLPYPAAEPNSGHDPAGRKSLGALSGSAALAALPKRDERKIQRKRTSVRNGWIASRLAMGHPGSVSRMLSSVLCDGNLVSLWNESPKSCSAGARHVNLRGLPVFARESSDNTQSIQNQQPNTSMKTIKVSSIRPMLAIAFASILFMSCAQAATQIEYKVVSLEQAHIQGAEQLQALLNTLGAEGWELIEIDTKGDAIMKRQK